jgi:hypothetical protein
MRELAVMGKPSGQARTFGYDRPRTEKGTPIPGTAPVMVEPEAERIREACRRVLAGDSLYAVVRDWTAEGVPTIRGAAWSTTALRTVLLAPRIAGLRVHQGEVVGTGNWAPIVDEGTWRRVGAILTDPSRRLSRVKRSYLLSGLMHCARCGHPLVATPRRRKTGGGARGVYQYLPGETQRAYGCIKVHGGCGGVFVLAEGVEKFVTDALLLRLKGSRLGAARRRLVRADGGDDLAARVAEDEQALADLGVDCAEHGLPRTAFLAAAERISSRLAAAKAELATAARPDVLGDIYDLTEQWAELGLERQRAVVKAVLCDVTVGPATGPRNRFDPDRVQLMWRA